VLSLPFIFLKLFREFYKADHIHLRCPGNMGLLGALVQIFFPKKTKSAKYAGNWDPNAKQPSTYRFQKWLLNNTKLTKNMQVLVYGEWPKQSKNIKPFFTATYQKSKTIETKERNIQEPFRFLFVGMLSLGKHPLYAIQLVANIFKSGVTCVFDIYGDGAEHETIKRYIDENNLNRIITLHGNQDASVIEAAYKSSDFLILPSQSEGWPKVVAEAMFWGVIPIVSKISCVPWMLNYGKRGALLSMELSEDTNAIKELVTDTPRLTKMSQKAMEWSHQYTIDDFETEIKKLVK
jgi:glycosyltransferase involved in cell wall biosynthesis